MSGYVNAISFLKKTLSPPLCYRERCFETTETINLI